MYRGESERMNDFNIACFLSVCRTLSFTISADAFYMSQQAVSRNIQLLEEELGIRLFHRHYHAVHLTDAGREFYNTFTELSRNRSELQKAIEYGELNETLKIGYTLWSGMPPGIDADIHTFIGKDPAPATISAFEVPDGDIYNFLNSGFVDLAIITNYLAENIEADTQITPIAEIPLYCVFCADRPISSDSSLSAILHDRVHFASLAAELDDETVVNRVSREYAKLSDSPGSISILPNIESVYLEVLMGNGVTFSPDNRFIKCADLATIPLPWTATLCAVHLNDRKNPGAVSLEKYLAERQVSVE